MGKIGGLWDSFECPNFLYLTEENINWKNHKGYEWHGIIGESKPISAKALSLDMTKKF